MNSAPMSSPHARKAQTMRRHKAPVGSAILLVAQGFTFALLRWFLNLLPLPKRLSTGWQWALRRSFWNNLARLKFRGSRPQSFPVPRTARTITPVAFDRKFRNIPIRNIKVADRIPRDEMRGRNFFRDWPHKWLMRIFTRYQVWMYRLLSPMQPGLDEIHADPYEALRQAYPKRHRALLEPPVMPLELQGSPDLGALAVKGPYHGYLKKYDWEAGENVQENEAWRSAQVVPPPDWDDQAGPWNNHLFEWDFRSFDGGYQHHSGLYNLGCRVLFVVHGPTRTVRPIGIKSELGVSKPGEPTWEFAKKLALCAATNHLSLVRHFNGIHLASAAPLAIATRNHLPPDHPLIRLLWPYIYHTPLSNHIVTRAQMVPGGDFETVFSFTHRGICDLFSHTYKEFDFTVNDPETDAAQRGIVNAGLDTRTLKDLSELFEVFHRQAKKYLVLYYDFHRYPPGKDEILLHWLDALNHSETGIPNGVPVNRDNVDHANLSRLLATFMYMATVQHDIAGSFLWNYQLWAHTQPPRLYKDGRRLPLDVYQRLVNANFNLNVPRTPLMWRDLEEDWSYLAPPQGEQQAAAVQVWRKCQEELEEIEKHWRSRDPWHAWRVYPSMLEVNIND